MAEYLTNTADLTAVANAIRAKGGTSAPMVYPSGFVSAIQAIDTTGETKPATLTLTSSDYTGEKYGKFTFVNSERHIDQVNYTYGKPFTFPITIKTVIGGLVVFTPSGFPGIPSYRDLIGGEIRLSAGMFYILVTSPQASINIYNND